MDLSWDAGITLIRALQSAGWLALPMQAITLLGAETFFLAIIPLLYWCVDTRLGTRVGLILLLSTSLNCALKLVLADPRPYWYSSDVRALAFEPTFGLPSAHAQNTVAVWGALAAGARRGWAWALALLLSALIGLSRLYLGVHFPADVLAGWAIGGVVLAAFLRWFDPAGAWLGRQPAAGRVALVLVSALLLLLPSVLLAQARAGWQMPGDWLRNAQAAFPGEAPEPLALDTPLSTAGTWCGFGLGLLLLGARRFYADGSAARRLGRYLVGMAVVLLIWAGLRALLPDDASLLAQGLRFARYALIGLWIAAGAPALFRKIGLAD